jgi:ABC-type uncharacterized transport system permease subunit
MFCPAFESSGVPFNPFVAAHYSSIVLLAVLAKKTCPAKRSLRRKPKWEQGTVPPFLTLDDRFFEKSNCGVIWLLADPEAPLVLVASIGLCVDGVIAFPKCLEVPLTDAVASLLLIDIAGVSIEVPPLNIVFKVHCGAAGVAGATSVLFAVGAVFLNLVRAPRPVKALSNFSRLPALVSMLENFCFSIQKRAI